MARGPIQPGSLVRQSKRDQLAARDEAVARIEELLKVKPMTATELFKELGVVRGTVFNYLHYMHVTERTIHLADEKRGRARLWTLGADPDLPEEGVALDQEPRTAPAQQVGMWRDVLVAALFGPAPGAAA